MIQTDLFRKVSHSSHIYSVSSIGRKRLNRWQSWMASQRGCSLGLGASFSASTIRPIPIDCSNGKLMLKSKKAVWTVSSCLVGIPIGLN